MGLSQMSMCLPGICAELLGFLALQGGQVLLQSLQEAARGLTKERKCKKGYKGEGKVELLLLSTLFLVNIKQNVFPHIHTEEKKHSTP